MTKRLQVLLEDSELAEIQQVARGQRMTTAEWVRRSLRMARDKALASDTRTKLESISSAVGYSYPTGDIAEVLDEIERGYLGDRGTEDHP